MRILMVVACALLWSGKLSAQVPLTLEGCLDRAVEENIQVQISELSVTSAEVTYIQRKFDFLPTVAANLPATKTFGKTADIFTNQIASSPWTSQSSLGATFTVFRGLSKWSELHNAEATLRANKYSLEDLKNDIRLNTAMAFFATMYAADNLKIGQERLALLEKQLVNIQHQVDAGSKTQGDLYSLQAQLATERMNAVNQQNAYDRSMLDLVLLLNMDPAETYEVQRPSLLDTELEELEEVNAVFQAARLTNPGVLKQEFAALAAKYAIRTAKAAYYPTFNVTFGLGSFFSTNSRRFMGYGYVDGIPQAIFGPRIPIGEQLGDNFSQSLNLVLSVPIFTRGVFRQNQKIAELNHETAELRVKSEELDLYRTVQQAHLDARAADARYAASKTQTESLTEALRYAQARYDAGMMDFVAYLEVLNNHTRAAVERTQSQYDRVLKRKILDIYQGKPLTF